MSCAKADLIKFGSRSQPNLIGFSLAIIFVTLPWACQESFSISKWQRLAWSGSDEIDFHKPKVILHDSFFSSLDVWGMRRKALVKLSPQPTTHFNIHQSSTAREMGKFTGNGSFHFCCVVFFLLHAAHYVEATWAATHCGWDDVSRLVRRHFGFEGWLGGEWKTIMNDHERSNFCWHQKWGVLVRKTWREIMQWDFTTGNYRARKVRRKASLKAKMLIIGV